jgi:hypothetical protein
MIAYVRRDTREIVLDIRLIIHSLHNIYQSKPYHSERRKVVVIVVGCSVGACQPSELPLVAGAGADTMSQAADLIRMLINPDILIAFSITLNPYYHNHGCPSTLRCSLNMVLLCGFYCSSAVSLGRARYISFLLRHHAYSSRAQLLINIFRDPRDMTATAPPQVIGGSPIPTHESSQHV